MTREEINTRINAIFGEDSDIGDAIAYCVDIALGEEQWDARVHDIVVRAFMYSYPTDTLQGIMQGIMDARRVPIGWMFVDTSHD